MVYSILHPYSDAPRDGIRVRCYAYPELFAEKIRALGDRARPRDLYDVVHLYRRHEALRAASNVREILREKCAFKGLPVPTFEALQEHREELTADWHSMLAHQLPELPPFESYWDEAAGFFRWLEGAPLIEEIPAYQLGDDEEVLRPALGALGGMGLPARPLEAIRFAAANRLCVDLDYTAADGRRSQRRIEPYSLRRTRSGDVVLHAVSADIQQHRSYRVERIHGARITHEVFLPRYAIELSPTGPLLVPATSVSPVKPTPTRRPHRSARSSTEYVYECSVCSKRFRRTRPNPRLGKHKDRSGYPCAGRMGVQIF